MLPRVAAQGPKTIFLTAIATLSLANCVVIAQVDYSLIPEESGGSGGGGSGGSGGSADCRIDTDCDDDVPCTIDNCETGLCTHTPAPEGTDCGSMTCVSTATCNATGECTSAPIVVDDGDGCTNDVCNPQTGAISHDAVVIDDNIACTTDSCDSATGTISHTPDSAGCLSWQPLPLDKAPEARFYHTAVWTGSKMIVWGGIPSLGAPPLNSGGVYDPTNHTWTPTSTTGAPSGRHSHTAVWTGSKMIVWGGYATTALAMGGAAYDPETDTWTALPTMGEPTARFRHTAVWSGERMLIFGGAVNVTTISQGASFDPATNTWANLPTMGQPSTRAKHTALWAGDRMIIWGGYDNVDWLWTGSSYLPATNMWNGTMPITNAPEVREQHSAVWTGSRMLVWGGWNGGQYLNTGGVFDPIPKTWTMSTSTAGAPSGRVENSAVWTGTTMVIWGGCGGDLCATMAADGGIYTPDASGGSWIDIPAVSAMPGRHRHTTVWTGSKMIVWGGRDQAQNPLNTGAETPL